jgi:predicted small secreted protein
LSPKLNLFIGVLALLSLPALSACNTGGGGTAGVNEDMQAAGEGRGTDSVGEQGISGEVTTGPIEEEDAGLPGGAIGAAEEEQGAPDAATMGAGGTGSAAQ